MLVFDIETDGFLADMTKIHCLNIYDRTTQVMHRFNGETIYAGVHMLHETAVPIGGHNVHEFDVPAIQKLFPWFAPKHVVDSRAWSRLIWPVLDERDFAALRKGKLPAEFQKAGLIGMHSLEAWGWRMGERKGSFAPENYTNPETGEPHTWKTIPFSQDMDDYCAQDVMTNVALFQLIESKQYDPRALEIENEVARICAQMQRNGFRFDRAAAESLYAAIQIRRVELEAKLQLAFPPWQVVDKCFTPKVNNKARGYVKGVPITTYKMRTFNPGSRDDISDRLIKLMDWSPQEFTDGGKPKVDESVLEAMSFPEAKLLNEYLLVQKRLAQIGDGKNGWLKLEKDGRIYGRVNTNGAITARMTHNSPNIAQVPKVGTEYGTECRSCFTADDDWVLVGCDAAAIELCLLGHYLARFDGGEYSTSVVSGTKELGTDVHNVHKRALDFNSREIGKTWTYAMLYGAGSHKLGTIVVSDFDDAKLQRFNAKYPSGKARDAMIKRLGEQSKEKIKSRIPALGQLMTAVEEATKSRGFIKALDGRILPIRHKHAALNTLLQSAGAIVVKKALVLFDADMVAKAIPYKLVAVVHDELQTTTPEVHAEEVGRSAAAAISRAGIELGVRCPLSGSFSYGPNWASSH